MMMTVLEKVRRLEQYLSVSEILSDSVLETGISKIIEREYIRIMELRKRLSYQLSEFEHQYFINSTDFYQRYESGEMGDETDFTEWASTVEMLKNIDKRLCFLEQN